MLLEEKGLLSNCCTFTLFLLHKKRKQLAYKPGSVLHEKILQRLSFICACRYRQTIAVYPPARASNPQTLVYMTLQLLGRTARSVTTRLVGSYSTFSPLPRLNEAVVFFCAIPYFFIGAAGATVMDGLRYAFAWWIAGIPWDFVHGAGNFCIMLVLYHHVKKAMNNVNRYLPN